MSNRKYSALSLTAMATSFLVFAVSSVFGAESGNAGRDLTRTKCKTCHVSQAQGGTMTPLSKTQKQWERFFEKQQHDKKSPGAWKQITPRELEQIRRYLIDHAADSPHPETCG